MLRMIGYTSPEEVVGRPILDFVHPDYRERLTEEIEAVYARGGELGEPSELVVIGKDGSLLEATSVARTITYEGEPGIQAYVLKNTEHRRAARALAESEEKFRLAFENAKDAIFWADPETGSIVECNKAAEVMLEREREDIVGLHQSDLHPPDKTDYYGEMFRQHVEQKKAVGVEAAVLTASGKEIPVEINAAVTMVGEKLIIQGIFRDVTERRRAEEKIHRGEREKAAVLSSMSEHVLYHNTELEILWANEAAASSVGLSPTDLVGRHCYEIWHGRGQPCENCPVVAALQTGGPHEEEVTTPDGRAWVIRGYPIKDAAGNVTNAVEVTLEITERKRAEEELRRTLAENEALLEAVPDLMFVIDKEGNYVDFKRAEADLFALPPESIVGKNIRDTGFSAADEKEIFARLEETLRSGKTTTAEYTLQTPRGAGAYEARMTKLNDEEVLAVVREITERKEAEEALRREKRFSESVMNSLPGIFYVFDAEGRSRWWNKNLETVTEYSAEEVSRMRPTDFFRGRDKEIIAERIARALAEGYASAEARLVTKGGAEIPYFFTGKRVEMHGKTYLMGLAVDLAGLTPAEKGQEKSE